MDNNNNKRKVKELNLSTNLKYDLSYETMDYYSCQYGSSCCDNDFCRCREITGYDFSNAFYNAQNFIINYSPSSLFEELYLEIMWLKNQKKGDLLNDWFEGHSDRGYYGEETYSVTPTNIFLKVFKNFINLPIQKKFEEALKSEYGFILPALSNPVSFSFEKVKFKDIVADKKVQLNTSNHFSYNFCVSQYNKNMYNKEKFINHLFLFPMCIKEDTGKYRIVDGHHRYKAFSSSNSFNRKSIHIFCVRK